MQKGNKTWKFQRSKITHTHTYINKILLIITIIIMAEAARTAGRTPWEERRQTPHIPSTCFPEWRFHDSSVLKNVIAKKKKKSLAKNNTKMYNIGRNTP